MRFPTFSLHHRGGHKVITKPNLCSALVREPGGWGWGDQPRRGKGPWSTREINTKEFLYLDLAEALQGAVALKEALDWFQ